MLDERTESMLRVANLLTAEDLDRLRTLAPVAPAVMPAEKDITTCASGDPATGRGRDEIAAASSAEPLRAHPRADQLTRSVKTPPAREGRGEYERLRTRESKISTVCVGREREKHDWWPLGTELVGHMGSQAFTAMVVENQAVKSGRSLLLTSGPANGKVCHTPTRAAIEATEAYRQAHNLGRGGGVTNGWDFWKRNHP